MKPHEVKKYFTFWSINENNYLLKNIGVYYFLFFVPLIGLLSFLVFFILRFSKINQFIFSSKKYTYKYLWRNLYYCFLFPTIISIFYFMFPYIFINKNFNVDNHLFLYSSIGILFILYWIGHLVLIVISVKNFNLRIQGLKNEYFYLYNNKNYEGSYQKVLDFNKLNLLKDIKEKNIFLDRFYCKKVPLKNNATIVSEEKTSNDVELNKKNQNETNFYLINSFYKDVRHLLEYDEANSNKNFYLDFYKNTNV